MKNIHILPTDKPSRVYKHLGRELYHTVRYFEQKGLLCINQNIYITSDEEIKEEGYVFWEGKVYKYREFMKMRTPVYTDYFSIILTTDQDLIKDGVQAIDDEFLTWFVKNPSCEFVEVEKDEFYSKKAFIEGKNAITYEYKIIIPKEEPTIVRLPTYYESKQETLEEAAEREASLFYEKGSLDWNKYRQVFIEGAKWQSEHGQKVGHSVQVERSYNEEEVLNLLKKAHFVEQNIEEWFEQFKKK